MDQKQKTFKTPEEVAKQDNMQSAGHAKLDDELAATGQRPKLPKKHRLHLTKKQWTQVGIATVIILVGGSYLGWKVLAKEPSAPAASVQEPTPEPAPTSEQSKLTGVEVPVGTNDSTPVTAVMIENSPDARPQAGIRDAGVVYEAIAEGGITRFVTFFQESKPDYIGPVRSVRPYYLDFVKPYDAPLAHAGGSGEALAQIANEGFKDLDYTVAGSAYQRVNTRYAPHNLYTSRAKLLEAHKSKGWDKSNFTGMKRAAKPGKAAATTTAATIDLAISSYLYNPTFTYDKTANTYRRAQGGQPHVDEKTGKQITPNVVVALVMSHRYSGIYSVYNTTGSGTAYIFQNGTVTTATWKKPNRATQISLVDANGKDIELNPGQTWFSLVADKSQVSYKP
jgi:hypothetical protein